MPIVKTQPYLQLELTVDSKLIRDFGLKEFIFVRSNDNPPEFSQIMINFEDDKKVTFPFTFSPFFKDYSEEYWNDFLKMYTDLVKDIDEVHHDNILFISYSYHKSQKIRRQLMLNDNALRKRGSILLDLIKVPIPILNRDNIYEAFADDPNLEVEDIKSHILAYLEIAYIELKPGKPVLIS